MVSKIIYSSVSTMVGTTNDEHCPEKYFAIKLIRSIGGKELLMQLFFVYQQEYKNLV